MPTNQISSAPFLQSSTTTDQYRYNGELPADLAVQEQAINRRQQLANLLMQRGLQPAQGQTTGRFYVPPSPMQGLAQLAQAGVGAYGSYQNERDREGIAKQNQEMMADAIAGWKKANAPDETAQPMPSVRGAGGDYPTTRAEMPDTFDVDALQGGPQVVTARPVAQASRQYTGDITSPMTTMPAQDMTGIPIRENAGMQPTSQTVLKSMPAPRERVAQALIDLQLSQHPQIRQFGAWQAGTQERRDETALQREFLSQQNELNRDVRREGIEANALTRVEQIKNTMALTHMQIDAKMQAGQDANALKQQLADQNAELQKALHGIDARSRENVATIGADARLGAAGIQSGAKGKLPPAIGSKFMENSQNLRMAENALVSIGQHPDATGVKGYLPDAILQRTDPAGVDARAAIANLGSMVIHDRSGAAVTAAEFPRLRPFIPSATDSPDVAKKKLAQFVTEYKNINQEMTDFYRESGYGIPENWHQAGGSVSGPASQAAPAGPFKDPDKERRYQEYRKNNP